MRWSRAVGAVAGVCLLAVVASSGCAEGAKVDDDLLDGGSNPDGAGNRDAPCTAMCNGRCADLKTDNANCGKCGIACPTGATCVQGGCQCGSTQMKCGNTCVDLQKDNTSCHDGWCRILPGCFQMGSPPGEWGRGANTEEIIEVTLTHPFLIQQYELTQAQWTSLGFPNRSGVEDAGAGGAADCLQATCPASFMTWAEAVKFANAASQADGREACYQLKSCSMVTDPKWKDVVLVCDEVRPTKASVYDCDGYRLPTDAEWEYAARAGTKTAFYSGDITPYAVEGECKHDPNLDKIGWYCWNSGGATHPVGQKSQNAWGVYDMSGNAYEFTGDPFQGRYTRTSADPWQALTPAETDLTRRGGVSYGFAHVARSAYRLSVERVMHGYTWGFRLARTLAPNEVWKAGPLPVPYADAGAADAAMDGM